MRDEKKTAASETRHGGVIKKSELKSWCFFMEHFCISIISITFTDKNYRKKNQLENRGRGSNLSKLFQKMNSTYANDVPRISDYNLGQGKMEQQPPPPPPPIRQNQG